MNRMWRADRMRRTSALREVWLAVPGDLTTATGGYAYARRLLAALPDTGWRPRLIGLSPRFPFPTAQDVDAARNALAAVPAGAPVIVDGLAFGAMPRATLEGLACRLVALVHHPLALETGLPREAAESLHASERAALNMATAVIASSAHTAQALIRDYAVPAGRIRLAWPGIDPAPRIRPSDKPRARPSLLLGVGAVTPRKGFDTLVRALSTMADLSWSCLIVGSLDRDAATAASLRDLITSHRLGERIILAGEVSDRELDRAYREATAFVLPSRHEGYGMVFAEALTHALPIVACRAGAVPQTVPADAGILVPVDDDKALASALRTLLSDDPSRQRMADAAWRHGQTLPRWSDTARAVANMLEGITA